MPLNFLHALRFGANCTRWHIYKRRIYILYMYVRWVHPYKLYAFTHLNNKTPTSSCRPQRRARKRESERKQGYAIVVVVVVVGIVVSCIVMIARRRHRTEDDMLCKLPKTPHTNPHTHLARMGTTLYVLCCVVGGGICFVCVFFPRVRLIFRRRTLHNLWSVRIQSMQDKGG